MSAAAHDVDLFGTPTPDPEQSQFFTPPWLARRAAHWVPAGQRVIEPSCGSGNLVEALFRQRHDPKNVLAVERDYRWADFAFDRFGQRANILVGDFLTDARIRLACQTFRAECVFMNPPYEDNAHMDFVLRALELAPVVVGIFPVSFEYTQERDRLLWASKAYVARRARLPARVDFGGGHASGSSDHVVLKIKRRSAPRHAGEVLDVVEEVWTEGETC